MSMLVAVLSLWATMSSTSRSTVKTEPDRFLRRSPEPLVLSERFSVIRSSRDNRPSLSASRQAAMIGTLTMLAAGKGLVGIDLDGPARRQVPDDEADLSPERGDLLAHGRFHGRPLRLGLAEVGGPDAGGRAPGHREDDGDRPEPGREAQDEQGQGELDAHDEIRVISLFL